MRYPSFEEWYNNHYEDVMEENEPLEEEEIDWLDEYEKYISGLEDQAYEEWRDCQMMKDTE